MYLEFDDDNAVVKIVTRLDILTNEINILTKLQRQMQDVVIDGIIKLINSSETAMLLKPRAVGTFKECNKPVLQVKLND
jgi:hypothetical protein